MIPSKQLCTLTEVINLLFFVIVYELFVLMIILFLVVLLLLHNGQWALILIGLNLYHYEVGFGLKK